MNQRAKAIELINYDFAKNKKQDKLDFIFLKFVLQRKLTKKHG